jgi:hypothetical protein
MRGSSRCAARRRDYIGTLKRRNRALTPAGMYFVPATAPSLRRPRASPAYRFKLGYKYSRYFAVEGE